MPFQARELIGRWVRLEPLLPEHREPLRFAADDARIWQHTIEIARGPAFDVWFDHAMAERQAGRRIPYAVRRGRDGSLIGSTSYLDVVENHKRVEIGSTWYVPEEWGQATNPECKLLLLKQAYEEYGVNRVALVTDSLNTRSQAAIAKLGATKEGILRNHMVVQAGRIRHSVIFSILVNEWPATRQRLEARLETFAKSDPGGAR